MSYRARGVRWSPGQYQAFTWPAVLVGVILLLVGLAMILFWADFISSGGLDQGLATVDNNVFIVPHILAEVLTALLAIVGGFGLFIGRGWGMATALVALGGILYTSVNSLSHSLRNAPELTPVFLGVLAATLLSFLALHYSRIH